MFDLRANQTPADLSIIQAKRSAIQANWSDIKANHSAIQSNRSTIKESLVSAVSVVLIRCFGFALTCLVLSTCHLWQEWPNLKAHVHIPHYIPLSDILCSAFCFLHITPADPRGVQLGIFWMGLCCPWLQIWTPFKNIFALKLIPRFRNRSIFYTPF